MGQKISLCKWHNFCMAPWLICLFVTLLYIERKWLMRNFARVLPLRSKLSGKFQRFNAVNGSMEMLINSWISKKFKLKWTVLKHFKQWTALRKLFSPLPPPSPPAVESFLRHWNKNFLTEIYSNIKTLAFNYFENAVLWVLEMVQRKCFFWYQPKTCLLENWLSERGFLLCCGSIFFALLNEMRFVKWVRFFEQNCIVKWVIFIASFCWLWDCQKIWN